MKIDLTSEQLKQLNKDGYIEININEHNGQYLYFEFHGDMSFRYGEIAQKRIDGRPKGWAFNDDDLRKLNEESPIDPSYWHNDPLCPSCRTYMIYNFEHCPKCGQKIKWSGYVRE